MIFDSITPNREEINGNVIRNKVGRKKRIKLKHWRYFVVMIDAAPEKIYEKLIV